MSRVRRWWRVCKRAYATAKQYGRFSDSPRERLEDWVVDILVHPTLPNIMLGGALMATVNAVHGQIPWGVPVAAWLLTAVFMVVYIIGDELVRAYTAASEAFEDDAPYLQ